MRDPQAFHKYRGTLFSRSPELCPSSLHCRLSRLWGSCRSFISRWTWRAREGFDWTRGTTPIHTPWTLPLVCLSLFSPLGWVADGSSSWSRCSPPPPRPLPPHPSAPLLLLILLRPVEYLSLSLRSRRKGCPRTSHCILYLTSLKTLQGTLTPWVAHAAV